MANFFSNLRSILSNLRHNESTLNLIDHQSPSSSNGGVGGRNVSTDYTELMGGHVPCPSCNGSGLIPKELESTLVALIPVNDERLKPKKTWIYILIWILICVLIGGTLLFLLMPRTVTLSSNNFPVETITVTDRDKITHGYLDFYFMNKVNISSGNYLPVNVVNITATIINKFQPWSSDVVGHGLNDTFTIHSDTLELYRNTKELYFNNSVELKGVVAEYCQTPFSILTSLYVSLHFDIAVTLRYYYGHQEQVTLSTEQQVCCIPSGNCTSSW
jgi:hypothetical protein